MIESLRVGTAKTDVTPGGPCDLSGYAARTQPSLGVHDPVWVRGLGFEAGGVRAALLACDLLGFEPNRDRRIRQRMADELDCAATLLTCTHTHGGPASMHLIGCGTPDDAWMIALEDTIVETARRALDALAPASVLWAQTEARIGMNRRAAHAGRAVHLSREADRPAGTEAGPYDPALAVVQWVCAGKARATLMNLACHPVSLGAENRTITCDYAGVAVRSIERARDERGCGMGVFVQGACGDVNPDVSPRGFAECERIGMEVAEAAREAMRAHPRPLTGSPIRYAERRVSLPYRNDAGAIEVTLSALRIGDLAFSTLPGEAFCAQGMEVRAASPFPCTVIAAYSNGNLGYLPTRDAYPLGGYEVDDAHRYYGYAECVAPEAGELCVATALELLQECAG